MGTGEFFRAVELPQQQSHDGGVLFPTVLSPASSDVVELSAFEEAIKANKPWLESVLSKSGVILFRGFPVISPSDFNKVIEAFDFPELIYVGGQVTRTQVVGRVYTANESPLDLEVPFHHEMAYAKEFPTKLFFFCEVEPGEGGETPVVLSNVIYEKMKEKHPDFVAKLEEHGLKYIKVVGDEDDPSSVTGTSWKSAYKTDDKEIAKERAAKLGTTLEWEGNTVKFIMGPLPGVRFEEESRQKTWFNSLAIAYGPPTSDDKRNSSVELGNGDPIDNDAMKDLFKLFQEECVAIPWKKGDVMLVNNLTVLHSRRPLIKPPRSILASLCK